MTFLKFQNIFCSLKLNPYYLLAFVYNTICTPTVSFTHKVKNKMISFFVKFLYCVLIRKQNHGIFSTTAVTLHVNSNINLPISPHCKNADSTPPDNTHLLRKGKYRCMADLLFDWLGLSCFASVVLDRDLQVWLNPKQSNSWSVKQ